ncbi:MAG: hypothetical protein ACTS27_06195 [Phycisphaerales bacterium]
MSATPTPPSPPPHQPAPREGNTIGLIGFVLSLVGLIGCCFQPAALLSLAGLILSIIGLSKRPKGLAVTGTILGIIGLAGFLIVFLLIGVAVIAFVPLMIAVAALAGPEIETAVEQAILHQQVAAYVQETGSLPTDLSQVPQIDEGLMTDPWDTPYKLEVIDPGAEEYLIRSAGPDKVFDTEDDITNPDNN